MTETLTGKQVLALLAQDEVPEIEHQSCTGLWVPLCPAHLGVSYFQKATHSFRIKPTPARRLSVTLANGEVVSWPEPVREALKKGQEYWALTGNGDVVSGVWVGDVIDLACTKSSNVHLTREAAQEHADALRRINTQEVGKC